jgi:hypothetical protein
MPWYQVLAEMQAFRERTGSGLVDCVSLVQKARYKQARQQFDLLKARLGEGWTGSRVE